MDALPSAGWLTRGALNSVALPDGSIVIMGGENSTYAARNDVWRFAPAGSSVQDPSHVFHRPGNFPVVLQAFNSYGFNITRKAGYISVGAGNNSIIGQSATIFIGEDGLNVTHALNQAEGSPLDGTPAYTDISWWAPSHPQASYYADKTIELNGRYRLLTVAASDFAGYTGALVCN